MILTPVVVDMDVGNTQTVPMDVGNGHLIPMDVSGVFPISPTTLQEKTVTPDESAIEVVPDAGWVGLSKVTVAPIPENYGRIVWNGEYILVY